MALRSGGLLRLGLGVSVPVSVEIFSEGVVNVDSQEIFSVLGVSVVVSIEEPFSILGFASASSIEPFTLGETILVDSVEPFSILSSGSGGFLGVGSPAAPLLGWRNRS